MPTSFNEFYFWNLKFTEFLSGLSVLVCSIDLERAKDLTFLFFYQSISCFPTGRNKMKFKKKTKQMIIYHFSSKQEGQFLLKNSTTSTSTVTGRASSAWRSG
jgi:hypothetical protein